MFKKISCLFLTVMLLICIAQPSTAIANSENAVATSEEKIYCTATLDSDFADDSVIVVMTNSASLAFKEYRAADFSEIDCKSVQNLTDRLDSIMQAKVNGYTDTSQINVSLDIANSASFKELDPQKYTKILNIELKESGKANVLSAIKLLEKRSDILYVGPNYHYYPQAIPNDTYYSQQQSYAELIDLPNAWNITTGSSSVRVGIIDSGIDTTHPDLLGKVYGSISDTFGKYGLFTAPYNSDIFGHGTQVAGVIGAQGHNNAGISGVCWNVTLVSLKVSHSSESGSANTRDIIDAVEHAATNNIPILNCSLGKTRDGNSYDVALASTINNNYTGLFICSAGNDTNNNDINSHYPSTLDCPRIIAVGASTSSDAMASFSNYGKNTVDLFAPGEGILTTAKCLTGCSVCNGKQPGYHSVNGTSFAAPYVTGVAALIKSKYPNLTSSQIKQRIMLGVIDVKRNGASVFGDLCVSGGRLNAYRAVHDHTCTYMDFDYPTTHLACCYDPLCNLNFQEEHAFDLSGSGYACSKCGYYTDLLPYAFDNSETT